MITRRARISARAKGCVLLALFVAPLPGCQRWVEDMWKQPKYVPGRPAPLFPDGQPQRPQPPGTQAHVEGSLASTSSGRKGAEELALARQAEQAQALPPSLTAAFLARGQAQYGIYCLPCHSPVGDGDGWIVRRGFPAPPSYHTDRLRQAADRHFYEVITSGYGIMYSYADRISPEDRWAIVAFIRALQLSQHAPFQKLPPSLRNTIEQEGRS